MQSHKCHVPVATGVVCMSKLVKLSLLFSFIRCSNNKTGSTTPANDAHYFLEAKLTKSARLLGSVM